MRTTTVSDTSVENVFSLSLVPCECTNMLDGTANIDSSPLWSTDNGIMFDLVCTDTVTGTSGLPEVNVLMDVRHWTTGSKVTSSSVTGDGEKVWESVE